jgi:hypothetical protein
VDEAAPPALMKALAIEIIKRKLVVSWWANVRFEKSFTQDLCYLLKASGCIAVSGGLEVASDRLLELIQKGITVAQVAKVSQHFNDAGIMVHAYLMYGFPTQTIQETVDALEMVRQLFETGVLKSAFWHLFTMTAHSPVGLAPENYKVKKVSEAIGSFANNDIAHVDTTGANHEIFGYGLKKAILNYMHGACYEFPLQKWFEFKIPKTSIAPNYIQTQLDAVEIGAHHRADEIEAVLLVPQRRVDRLVARRVGGRRDARDAFGHDHAADEMRHGGDRLRRAGRNRAIAAVDH